MKNNLNIKLDDSTNSSTSDSAKPVADIWRTYYKNGQIKCETPLVNVEKHGIENGIMKVVNYGVSHHMKYDSKADTLLHSKRVAQLLTEASSELIRRANVHDHSKLESPEKELFDEFTPKLKDCTYGSDEYKEFLNGLKVALDHHYANNSHHPEHYENGVNGFDLFDLIEMFFDWKAATERHADGNIMKSIEINKGRFALSEQLCDIMRNTALRLGYDK